MRPTEGDCAADEDGNPALCPPLPHPTSARFLLKEPAPSKPASGRGRPRLGPSRWRGGSRLVPCRAPGPEACGKAIRNLGSVVTFRIWGVFTSNWSIVSLGERKVRRGANLGKGSLLSPGGGSRSPWETMTQRQETQPGRSSAVRRGETGQVALRPSAPSAPWREKG